MKLSERHWKISELARLAYEQRRAEDRRWMEEEERADMAMAAAMAPPALPPGDA